MCHFWFCGLGEAQLCAARLCASSVPCAFGSGCFWSCIIEGQLRARMWKTILTVCQLVLATLGMLQVYFMLPCCLWKSRSASSLKRGSWVPREWRENISSLLQTSLGPGKTSVSPHLLLLFKASHMTSPGTKVNKLHLVRERVASTNGDNRNCWWPSLKMFCHTILHTCISLLVMP